MTFDLQVKGQIGNSPEKSCMKPWLIIMVMIAIEVSIII